MFSSWCSIVIIIIFDEDRAFSITWVMLANKPAGSPKKVGDVP